MFGQLVCLVQWGDRVLWQRNDTTVPMESQCFSCSDFNFGTFQKPSYEAHTTCVFADLTLSKVSLSRESKPVDKRNSLNLIWSCAVLQRSTTTITVVFRFDREASVGFWKHEGLENHSFLKTNRKYREQIISLLKRQNCLVMFRFQLNTGQLFFKYSIDNFQNTTPARVNFVFSNSAQSKLTD